MNTARRLLLAGALLIAAAPAHAWDDYQVIYWQQRNAAQLATLKRLGVTAATVIANRDGAGTPVERQYAPMLANGLRWYVENIATDFYSAYHRWSPDRPVNWRFAEAQRRLRDSPDDATLLSRDPSLVDPLWRQRIADRLTATVREQAPHRPLYYSLGDETGIADLSAFSDFDFSPGSLAGMRAWLRQGYGSLAALNAEWGSDFARWDDVRPETTRQAMRRGDDNFAAWADFKAWMDVAFAQALRFGVDAVHAGDPAALAAIEGVQVPGWGGYNYALLAGAVDVMELDDLPLAHSLDPRLVLLTTSFRARPRDIHAIWRDLLGGSRGLILWDSDNSVVREDGAAGLRGEAYAATFAAISDGIARLLFASEPQIDPVAILYSPASFRVQWMLEQRPHGDAWMRRTAESEIHGNAAREAMGAYRHAVTHLGLQPRYVTPAMLAGGDLQRLGVRALILPHALALSADEARAIGEFAAAGGTVIADVPPGAFDQHGKRLARPLLDAGLARIMVPEALSAAALGVTPRLRIEAPDADVTFHVWRHGDDTIIAAQRDFAEAARDETVVLHLPRPARIYDLGRRQSLGRSARVTLTLDAVAPALLSVAP